MTFEALKAATIIFGIGKLKLAAAFLYFDGTGFDSCTYNLLDGLVFNSGSWENLDIMQAVAANNQLEGRIWSLASYMGSKKVAGPHPLKIGEVCSVNLLINPYQFDFHWLLKPRSLMSQNLFLYVVDSDSFKNYVGIELESIKLITAPTAVITYGIRNRISQYLAVNSIRVFEAISQASINLKGLATTWETLNRHFRANPVQITVRITHSSKSAKCDHMFSFSTSIEDRVCREDFMLGQVSKTFKLHTRVQY